MCDEIPGARLEHEAQGIEGALDDPSSLAVARTNAFPLPDRRCERGQVRGLVLPPKPASRVQMEETRGALRALLQLRGEGRQKLQARIREHPPEAEFRRRS